MSDGEMRVFWEDLRLFTGDVFHAAGLSREDAEIEAEVLVWANLRGVDSHGVLRVAAYVDRVDEGVMKTKPDIRVENETPATVLIEADQAFGPVVTTMAMKKVIKKASEVGIGWGSIRNTTHQGAMAYYPLMAAKEGMAGIAMVCSPPNMAPFGAKAPGLHNAPISIAVPGNNHPPVVLDMATSVAAGGKLKLAGDKEESIPLGWALDAEGNPTTDPNLGTILLPFGGPKGSGLALMIECLSSLTVGNPLIEPALSNRGSSFYIQNSIVAAIDISTFTDIDQYRSNIDAMVKRIKELPRADGFNEILVPGELEDRVHEDRAENGIPLPVGTVRNLKGVAERFGLEMPEAI